MGRLKKDHSGWKSHGKWLKYQHPKIEEVPKQGKKSKNTRKWCKGKVGVKHDYELSIPRNDHMAIRGFRKLPICNNCGKQDYRGVLYKNKETGEYEERPWPFLVF